ncbi:trypsin-like peptidase domain-containing protein [Streptomyces chiangmaiensis]
MAGRDSRTANSGREGRSTGPGLVRLWDPAGRPRGTGFAVDHDGTVITGHEAVDGIEGLLQGPDERVCAVSAAAVTPLPHAGLALVRTEGLGLQPLPVTVRDRIETGTYVRIAAGDWREARVLATTAVTYRAPDRHHRFDAALELAGTAAPRRSARAAVRPVARCSTPRPAPCWPCSAPRCTRNTGRRGSRCPCSGSDSRWRGCSPATRRPYRRTART